MVKIWLSSGFAQSERFVEDSNIAMKTIIQRIIVRGLR
jgi:hypothetical protein